ncbi:23S rRNA (pseudouridine(1915)-N(3))-methyltransferase RlmH [Membranihabitans maritimus]|uniref:23S rRNA (pseudouridine(1915)-N(3))-methyltransferase RlmH n=1 Tax=Membranihabitans maritimus TaxID=2904244 RepID=UPI001F461215|nr:23S rRNA (pseudouridine(1915)-N(3))-methyltransferase RlmH [Membranihabitans maritimus]
MKIALWVIGKTKSIHFKKGIEDYRKRVKRFHTIEFIDIEIKGKSKNPEALRKIESEKILSRLKPSDFLVLLDEKGESLSSMELSTFLKKRMLIGNQDLIFLIGGPFGFDESVYLRAQMKLSLSKMTFPHEMAKLIFAEQLYRAFSILHNSSYHHE